LDPAQKGGLELEGVLTAVKDLIGEAPRGSVECGEPRNERTITREYPER
jgi:hypothetical protein